MKGYQHDKEQHIPCLVMGPSVTAHTAESTGISVLLGASVNCLGMDMPFLPWDMMTQPNTYTVHASDLASKGPEVAT